MAQVQGHSIEEQWDLSMQFEGLVELALHQTVETYIALATGKALAAAAGFDAGTPSVYAIWQKQVDTSLGPFVYATFESAALNVAHGVVNTADLPLGHGVPLISDDFTAGYVAQVKNKMVNVSDDLWNTINQELQKGVAANESVEELSDRIRTAGSLTTVRANAVARTTVVQASNAGSLSQARLLGDDNVTKEWLATEDARTRPAHAHADTQKQPLAKPFEVGGFFLMYPGDPSGPASEVINCRCTLVYNFDENTEILHTCECSQADVVLAAVVPATSCVCPVTASLAPSGHVSSVTAADGPAIYKSFQYPSKISPAYGGAKIHKQLEPIKKAYGLTDADTKALLHVIDEQYALAGGKSSFAEKYEEWLTSPAGKKVVKVPMSAPSPLSPGFTMPTPASLGVTPVSTPVTSAVRGLKVISRPDVGDLKLSGSAGGTHGAQLYTDSKTGERWLYKPYDSSSEFGVRLDVTTAKIQARMDLPQPSTYTVRLNGKYGSIQSMHSATDAFPGGSFNPLKLSGSEVVDLQKEQVLDWLISNHDSHSGNFLRLTNGHLVGVDKGQAFKFFGKDKLDWTYHPNKMEKPPVYNFMWKSFAEGKNITMVDPATGELKDLIERTMAIPDAEYTAYLRPFAEQAIKDGKLAYGDLDKFYEAALKRKNNLATDFQKMYDKAVAERAKSLGSVVTPPLPPPVVAPPPVAAVATTTPDYRTFEANLLPDDKVAITNFANDIDDFMSNSGLTFDQAWQLQSTYVDGITGLTGLAKDEQVALLKAYGKKNFKSIDVSSWPTTTTTTTTAATPVTVPTVIVPATATTPATINLLDISTATDAEMKKLLSTFKAIKPVSPGWGGSAIMKNLQEAKKSLGPDLAKYNDGQLLKMLDQISSGTSTGKTFFSEAETWLKTPGGKKYAADVGLPSLPVPGAAAATTVPATVPNLGVLGDISGIDKATQQAIFLDFKHQGLYLSSPPSKIWDSIQALKKLPAHQKYTDVQLLKVLDQYGADKLGVTNMNLYEKKLVDWLKTKSGKDHIASIAKPMKTLKKTTKKAAKVTISSSSSSYVPTGPTGPVNLADIPRNISSSDVHFPNVDVRTAQLLQDDLPKWAGKEQASLRYYTGDNYTQINAALREDQPVDSALATHIHNAQAGMRPSKQPMTLWRGTNADQLGLPKYNATEADFKKLVGKTMEDKGFMSTSVGGKADFGGNVLLQIEAPVGSPMAFVKSISKYKATESEMLLAAGTRYKVLSVTRTGSFTSGFKTTVRVRIIP